jgi:hypothetical protein
MAELADLLGPKYWPEGYVSPHYNEWNKKVFLLILNGNYEI